MCCFLFENSINHAQAPIVYSDYTIHSVRSSGKNSQLLELIDGNGEFITAYIKVGDPTIKPELRLYGVSMERKHSTHGDYNLIATYRAA